jgi:hypothetical protein
LKSLSTGVSGRLFVEDARLSLRTTKRRFIGQAVDPPAAIVIKHAVDPTFSDLLQGVPSNRTNDAVPPHSNIRTFRT